ncbi:hypothetical protein [Atlantibacter hermannii]|uniref:hypothetical protein n=1 Tax=Atlantibacter hermannii TaxID=565 RepID=UPI002FE3D9E4
MRKIILMFLMGAFIFTTHARPPATDYRNIGYCIEAGRDNGDTDEEITDRCIPSGDSLEDYE